MTVLPLLHPLKEWSLQVSRADSVGKEVVCLAWMRMMGVDSVEYHEHTVAGRGDDPVAASSEYYS